MWNYIKWGISIPDSGAFKLLGFGGELNAWSHSYNEIRLVLLFPILH